MTGFKSKKITTAPTLGEILAQKREVKNLSLSQAARLSKISVEYLRALENSSYDQLPGEVYAKNFLRVYTRILDLDYDTLATQYLSEKKIYSKTKKINSKKIDQPVEKLGRINFLVTPKIIRNIVLGALVVVFLVYLGLKVQGIFAPPFLVVSSPQTNLITSEKVIEIAGQVEKEAILKINGQQVLADDQGYFAESVTLQMGSNLIEISAQKKHGKVAKVYRQVVVAPNQ